MNGIFLYGLATLGVGLIGLLIKYGFKSKCSDVKICYGLVSIKRDVEAEIKAEEKQLELESKDENII